MTRCAVWVVSCFVLFLSAVGAAHAQTPGTVPVWVDSQTLGDSPVAQCGDGTSVCVGPGTSAVTGQPAVLTTPFHSSIYPLSCLVACSRAPWAW
jgi:hypothetical protein